MVFVGSPSAEGCGGKNGGLKPGNGQNGNDGGVAGDCAGGAMVVLCSSGKGASGAGDSAGGVEVIFPPGGCGGGQNGIKGPGGLGIAAGDGGGLAGVSAGVGCSVDDGGETLGCGEGSVKMSTSPSAKGGVPAAKGGAGNDGGKLGFSIGHITLIGLGCAGGTAVLVGFAAGFLNGFFGIFATPSSGSVSLRCTGASFSGFRNCVFGMPLVTSCWKRQNKSQSLTTTAAPLWSRKKTHKEASLDELLLNMEIQPWCSKGQGFQ